MVLGRARNHSIRLLPLDERWFADLGCRLERVLLIRLGLLAQITLRIAIVFGAFVEAL